MGTAPAGPGPFEEGNAWATAHGVRYLDVCLEAAGPAPNAPHLWSDERVAVVRGAAERGGIHLGLHTLSGVNVAETAPFVAEAVDRYLEAYIALASRIHAEWIVVHGGF